MALESANYLNGLVSSNPSAGDPVTQADDHMRLIKAVLLSTFPNLNGPVDRTPAQLNFGVVPTGGIIMWSGATLAIPSGWALCDGGTYSKSDGSGNVVVADLRGKFVAGAGGSYAVNATGGAASVTATSAAAGAISTTGTTATGGAHSHGAATGSHALTIDQMPAHTHGYTYYRGPSLGETTSSASLANNAVTASTNSTGGGAGHTHTIASDAGHTHSVTLDVAAHTHSTVVATLPPFLALAYIQKL